MSSFFHGVGIQEVLIGPRSIMLVRSAVIGLIGTAPTWMVSSSATPPPAGVNKLGLVANQTDASAYGPLVQGYTIPYALDNIFNQGQQSGVGPILVINVFDPSVHFTLVSAKALSFPASGVQVLNLKQMGIVNNSVFKITNVGGTTTYVEGTDYTVDYINGVVTALTSSAITVGEAVLVTYDYYDPTLVQDSDIIGAITGGAYTGIQLFLTAFSTYGFFPKILIAPGHTSQQIQQSLEISSGKIRAVYCYDSPPDTVVATAITNRGVITNAFSTGSDRAILCFPNQEFYDTGLVVDGVTINSLGTPVQAPANVTADGPYSSFMAGVISSNDFQNGFWWSPSNQAIQGSTGPDIQMYISPFDPNDDTNLLGAAGIVTVFQSFGTGLKTWGNYSAAFPNSAAETSFICIRRTLDVIEESIQIASLAFVDNPISLGLVNTVLKSVNDLFRSMIQQGALLVGSVASFDPKKNPASQLGAGQVIFSLNLMPPPPAQDIQYDFFVDTSLLSGLTTSNSAV